MGKTIGNIGQWLSVFLMILGIFYLIKLHIDTGTILFSLGCFVDVIATKIKYYSEQFILRNKRIIKLLEDKYGNINNGCNSDTVGDAQQYHLF